MLWHKIFKMMTGNDLPTDAQILASLPDSLLVQNGIR